MRQRGVGAADSNWIARSIGFAAEHRSGRHVRKGFFRRHQRPVDRRLGVGPQVGAAFGGFLRQRGVVAGLQQGLSEIGAEHFEFRPEAEAARFGVAGDQVARAPAARCAPSRQRRGGFQGAVSFRVFDDRAAGLEGDARSVGVGLHQAPLVITPPNLRLGVTSSQTRPSPSLDSKLAACGGEGAGAGDGFFVRFEAVFGDHPDEVVGVGGEAAELSGDQDRDVARSDRGRGGRDFGAGARRFFAVDGPVFEPVGGVEGVGVDAGAKFGGRRGDVGDGRAGDGRRPFWKFESFEYRNLGKGTFASHRCI